MRWRRRLTRHQLLSKPSARIMPRSTETSWGRLASKFLRFHGIPYRVCVCVHAQPGPSSPRGYIHRPRRRHRHRLCSSISLLYAKQQHCCNNVIVLCTPYYIYEREQAILFLSLSLYFYFSIADFPGFYCRLLPLLF